MPSAGGWNTEQLLWLLHRGPQWVTANAAAFFPFGQLHQWRRWQGSSCEAGLQDSGTNSWTDNGSDPLWSLLVFEIEAAYVLCGSSFKECWHP